MACEERIYVEPMPSIARVHFHSNAHSPSPYYVVLCCTLLIIRIRAPFVVVINVNPERANKWPAYENCKNKRYLCVEGATT